MQTIPTDTRNRILAKYDAGRHTREEVAEMFDTSLGFVKKLLSQRKRLGHCEPLYSRAGRKPAITPEHRESIRELLKHNPGATLWMMREHIGLAVTTQAVHVVLGKMGIVLKKKHSAPRSRTAPTCSPPAKRGKPA